MEENEEEVDNQNDVPNDMPPPKRNWKKIYEMIKRLLLRF